MIEGELTRLPLFYLVEGPGDMTEKEWEDWFKVDETPNKQVQTVRENPSSSDLDWFSVEPDIGTPNVPSGEVGMVDRGTATTGVCDSNGLNANGCNNTNDSSSSGYDNRQEQGRGLNATEAKTNAQNTIQANDSSSSSDSGLDWLTDWNPPSPQQPTNEDTGVGGVRVDMDNSGGLDWLEICDSGNVSGTSKGDRESSRPRASNDGSKIHNEQEQLEGVSTPGFFERLRQRDSERKKARDSGHETNNKPNRGFALVFSTSDTEGKEETETNGDETREYDSYDEDDTQSNEGSKAYYRGLMLGQAGTGKTTKLKERIAENPKYGLLAATTGIAAVNLSSADCIVRTINSVLGFYDLKSLERAYQRGTLIGKMLEVSSKGVTKIIVDELSMMSDSTFEIIYRAIREVNNYRTVQHRGGLGLMLVGDFLQLPPVEGNYLFESPDFESFEQEGEIERLHTIHRQTDPRFLEALNHARHGAGHEMVAALRSIPEVTFTRQIDDQFPGTTIMGTNQQVDTHNFIRLQHLRRQGKRSFKVKTRSWGRQENEWKTIPAELDLCDDAYVMILNNDSEGRFANGSCGWIKEWHEDLEQVDIKLNDPKTGLEIAEITPITRCSFDKYDEDIHPIKLLDKLSWAEWKRGKTGVTRNGYKEYCDTLTNSQRKVKEYPYYDYYEELMVLGESTFLPVRLAWATTVHKSQGLTLDRCQIDYEGTTAGRGGKSFMGRPGMSYVALSRVRNPEGLRVVGTLADIAHKTNVDTRVLKWV